MLTDGHWYLMTFAVRLLLLTSLFLKSSGRQYRDFISLYNTARAVHHFIYKVPDEWGEGLYNLGGNCSMSILEVANKIAEIYKTRYKREIREITTKADVEASPLQNLLPTVFKSSKRQAFT